MANVKTNVVFIGDSITDYGTYPSILETQLALKQPFDQYNFYNAGLSSETLSGLSEPSHPGERPCVFQRLNRIIERTSPDIAIVLYGVNDGIYHPFSEERFLAYKSGVERIIEALTNAGSKVALVTPTPFDKISSSTPMQALESPDFSFEKIYENYDSVMEKYSEWVKSIDLSDWTVDIRTIILNTLAEKRENTPKFKSGDGIHFGKLGNFAIAKAIGETVFGVSVDMPNGIREKKLYKLILKKNSLLHKNLKETVGHTNADKEIYLTGEKLDTAVTRTENKIASVLAKIQKRKRI